uniref:Uncharacterized protein n=1 Tax=Chromera velia CCMP2878 TaxID=1169474 RepID=A0A0G4HJ55_9ALVE|eukprot:Cvel_7038.t1-p1 / transcript=Cvel_7038.t1 / gene=Cvel_7038 / organism=Chromera_velia_CCMP2878 / gene_product=hypothetical protein / transcript_product=hypothetical protein / location=Cvel_scaffold359:44589-46979(-) / protein_length=381 / sequence_SO=supercontig / SO=protein_coding / is_pseudo=false
MAVTETAVEAWGLKSVSNVREQLEELQQLAQDLVRVPEEEAVRPIREEVRLVYVAFNEFVLVEMEACSENMLLFLRDYLDFINEIHLEAAEERMLQRLGRDAAVYSSAAGEAIISLQATSSALVSTGWRVTTARETQKVAASEKSQRTVALRTGAGVCVGAGVVAFTVGLGLLCPPVAALEVSAGAVWGCLGGGTAVATIGGGALGWQSTRLQVGSEQSEELMRAYSRILELIGDVSRSLTVICARFREHCRYYRENIGNANELSNRRRRLLELDRGTSERAHHSRRLMTLADLGRDHVDALRAHCALLSETIHTTRLVSKSMEAFSREERKSALEKFAERRLSNATDPSAVSADVYTARFGLGIEYAPSGEIEVGDARAG